MLDGKQYEYGEIQTFQTLQRNGFTIGSSTQITFSSGNLQYNPKDNKWQFAINQYDFIGSGNENISNDTTSWLDLFGWGTGAYPSKYSTDNNDYQHFVDWGRNKIGNDAAKTWRTLTYDEWDYILSKRVNAKELLTIAQVNGVNGLILLPDGWKWVAPCDITIKSGFSITSGIESYATHQTITKEQWLKLETAGAVFLPAMGYRYGTNVYLVQDYGDYWCSTSQNHRCSYHLCFSATGAIMYYDNRIGGHGVRLVREI